MSKPICKVCKRTTIYIAKSPPCDHWGVKGNYYKYRCKKCGEEALMYKAQEGELVDFDNWEEVTTPPHSANTA